MIDKIKIVLEDFQFSEEFRKGFFKFGFGRTNPDVITWKRYIELDGNKDKRTAIENDEVYESEKEMKKHRIELRINENVRKDKCELIIYGSLRKWYYGIDSRRDFNKKDFCLCISKLANEIGIEDKSIWNSKVTKIETGVTLKMKDEEKGILCCIFDYIASRKNIYSDSGVEFKSSNYDVIFYDVLRRIYNRKGKKQSQFKKIAKNNFLFRYEIQSHKISGTPMFANKLNTLLKIYNNWDYIGENLLKTLFTVKFVNVLSPEISVELKESTLKTMKNYLVYQGIKKIGLENVRVLTGKMKKEKKSEFLKKLMIIYNQFLEKDTVDYKELYTQKLEKRIAVLSKPYRL